MTMLPCWSVFFRRIYLLLVAASVSTGLCSVAFAQEYKFQSVKYDTGEVTLTDINDHGVAVGTSFVDDVFGGTSVAFLWDDGEVAEITIPEMGLEEWTVNAINDHGVMVGLGLSLDDFAIVGFTWDGNAADTFAVPGQFLSIPLTITNDGLITGVHDSLDFDAGGVFQKGTSDVQPVDVPGFDYVYVAAGNDQGTIVGSSFVDATSDVVKSFILRNGSVEELVHPDNEVELVAINELGLMAGNLYRSNGDSVGFVYRDGTFHEVVYPESSYTSIYGINDAGWLVGDYQPLNSSAIYGFVAIPVPEPHSLIPLTFCVLWGRRLMRRR